jgi:ABC-2 type transport system permease protein
VWGRILALVTKELLVLLKDRRGRFVVIVPPLVQLLVFAHAASFEVDAVRLAVLDEDSTPASRELTARFAGSPSFRLVLHPADQSEMAQAIDTRAVTVALRLEQGFAAKLMARPPAAAQLIVDGRQSNTALAVVGYAQRIVGEFNADWARRQGLPMPPASLVVRAWFNPNLDSRWFIVPGLIAMLTMVVGLTVTALSVARERETGTFEQLLVAPFRPHELMLGKALPPFLIGLVEATLILIAAILAFRIPFEGDLALLYLGLVIFLVAVIGVGLMISAVCRTQQQAILGGFLFLVPAALLSGFATPVENMPEWLQQLNAINPLRWFLVVIRGVFLRDLPLDILAHQLWPMAAIATVSLGTATWVFRRRVA